MAGIADIIASLLSAVSGQQKTISPIPETVISPIPEEVTAMQPQQDVKQKVLDFYSKKMPKSEKDAGTYFPVVKDIDKIMEKEKIRPGAGVLGALQAFYESTGGRTTSNLFGVKPSGKSSKFANSKDAIEYQYGKNVLGGGSANRLNVLDKKEPLTADEIKTLYASYNPEGAYLSNLLDDYKAIMGK